MRAVEEAFKIRVQISAYFFIAFIGIELGELLRAEFAEQLFEHEMYNRTFLKRVEGRALVLLKLLLLAGPIRKRAAVICLSP